MPPQFQIKQRVHASLHGVYQAGVIEAIEEDPSNRGQDRYYVHWSEYDRRMDAWLGAESIRVAANQTKGSKLMAASTATLGLQPVTRTMSTRNTQISPPPPSEAPQPPNSQAATKGKGANMSNPKAVTRGGGRLQDKSFFGKPKNIHSIVMGLYEVEAWYFSPYHLARSVVRSKMESSVECINPNAPLMVRNSPIQPEISTALQPNNTKLHICPFCAHPVSTAEQVVQHLKKSCLRHPPGREVYRDPEYNIVMFEVDGKAQQEFAQHLALLSKLFLESKDVTYDMRPFIFYVLCEIDHHGCSIMGYFSKEKKSPDNYNLSCILTLPQYQGRGIGRFMVEVSYELTKRELKTGTPEKPLSDLGELTYRSYWTDTVLEALSSNELEGVPITIDALMKQTGMTHTDIQNVMSQLKIINNAGKKMSLHVTDDLLREHQKKMLSRQRKIGVGDTRCLFDPTFLCWNVGEYEIVNNPEELPKEYVVKETAVMTGAPVAPNKKRLRR